MYDGTDIPTLHLSLGDNCTSDSFSDIHYTGENKEQVSEAVPICEPVDPVFDKNRCNQSQHLVLEETDMLYAASTFHPFYLDAYREYDLCSVAYEFVHQEVPYYQMFNTGADNGSVDMLKEMEHQLVPEITDLNWPASVSSSTFSDRDVVTAWPGPIHAQDHDDYGSFGLLSIHLGHAPPYTLTDCPPGGGEATPGPSITDLPPTVVGGADAPPASVLPPPMPKHWRKIPQRKYTLTMGKRSFSQLQSVTFSVNGDPGFNMQRALDRAYAGLDGRDQPVLEDANCPVSCRLLFPGYPINAQCSQIAVKNWRKDPSPIQRSKLAHEVAKRVRQYLDASAVVPIDPSADPRWTIGHGCMRLEKMYLTNISWVSKGSIQPEIWVDGRDS